MLLTSRYVVPVTAPFIEDGAILVQGSEIKETGKLDELRRKYPNEEVKDYGLSALMPGFVNTHTHLCYTAMRGLFEDMPYVDWKRSVLHCEPLMQDEDWVNSARLGALELLSGGVTTTADISRTQAGKIAIEESGLRGVVYHEVSTMHAESAQETVKRGLEEIAKWENEKNTDRLKFGLAAGHVYACHPKVYKEIVHQLDGADLPVAMHIAGNQAEADFIRYGSSPFSVHATEVSQGLDLNIPPWLPAGTTPIRYIYNWEFLDLKNVLLIHAIHVDEEDIAVLQRKKDNVSIAFCPRINAKLGMGLAPIEEYINRGITVGLGSDSPAAIDTVDIIGEMRTGLLLLRAFGGKGKNYMKSEKMLRMATIDAAKALHMDDEIGSLEVGKKADIIAVDLHNSHQNPTSDPAASVIHTANQDNVKMTMIDGKILYENFVHKSGLDRDGIVGTAHILRKRLRKEMNDDELIQSIIKKRVQDIAERYKR